MTEKMLYNIRALVEQLGNADHPITQANFQRMWKTLILKRAQDVYEKEKHVRATNFVRIDRSMIMPSPLSDLLYSIGQFCLPSQRNTNSCDTSRPSRLSSRLVDLIRRMGIH